MTFVIEVFNDPPSANINVSPTPEWDVTVELDANSEDPDGGAVSHTWTIVDRPPGSTANLSNANDEVASITFDDERDIGDWRIRLYVDDDEGERVTYYQNITIPNIPPDISIEGNFDIDVLGNLTLRAVNAGVSNPAQDVDGGTLNFEWRVLEAPPGATYSPGHTWNGREISVMTFEEDITTVEGTDIAFYTFEVTATDNEGDSDSREIGVRIHNIPPDYHLVGNNEIEVGSELRVETDILTDEDGGDLEFSWEIIQSPNSSPLGPQSDYATSSALSLFTDESDAGTWVFRLHVWDNEGEEAISDRFVVLVDGPVEAEIDGPDQIGSLSFPLVLDGSNSEDTDSPCCAPDYNHSTNQPPLEISQGVYIYEWYLVDFPYEYADEYFTGRVDEVWGIPANVPSISLGFGDLQPGEWQFELYVEDAEGNEDSEIFNVTIVDEDGPPVAFLNPPFQNQLTDISGIIGTTLSLSGAASFDLDNVLAGEALGPGVGISEYSWTYTVTPPGCTALPSLPSNSSTPSFDFLQAGQILPPECLGYYVIDLTVTDDDAVPKTAGAQATISLSNCPSDLCILAPTTLNPEHVEFTENTDITIYYNLNSQLYDIPYFSAGLLAKLEIYREDVFTQTLVYTDYDPNVQGSDKGSILAFHWDGFYSDGSYPEPGAYTLKLSLVDHAYSPSSYQTEAPSAILLEVVEPVIENTTTQYVDHDDLSIGAEPVRINYSFNGGDPDQMVLKILDESSAVIYEETLNRPYSNTFNWNGIDATNTGVSPGSYQIELEAMRGPESLGVSERYRFFVYDLEISSPAGSIPSTAPGMYLQVNSDDDDQNNIVDKQEVATTEDDLILFDISVQPADLPGEFSLSSRSNSLLKAWTDAGKSAEIPLPLSESPLTNSSPTLSLFVEGLESGRDTLTLSFTTNEGLPLNEKQAVLNIFEMKVMVDVDNDYGIGGGTDSQQVYVDVGLWDYGFRIAADAFGAIGTVYNEQDDTRLAASGNPENFVGRDSKRFYFQVEDPSANLDPSIVEEIPLPNFEFYTLKQNLAHDEYPPNNRSLTLIETGVNTGIFTSKAVMLVSDSIDSQYPTNTGTALHPGMANSDQANHRTRYVSSINGFVEAKYFPQGNGGPSFTHTLPVFQRNPDYRRRLQVQAYCFADPHNLGINGLKQVGIDSLLRIMKERYVPAGIQVEPQYNTVTDSLDLPLGSTINLSAVDLAYFNMLGYMVASSHQEELIDQIRNINPANSSNENTVFLVFIDQLAPANRGQAFPDGYIFSYSVARNFVFIASGQAGLDYTVSHEVGHILTNATMTAAELAGTAPGWAPGGHYGGPQDPKNLMRNGTIVTSPRQVILSKRLWNDDTTHIVKQIERMRNTRFINP